ncbi:MAG: hypothetical protein ABI577_06575 [bacterium]
MKRLESGFRVEDVRGQTVGTVTDVRECCFEVASDAQPLFLVQSAIFDVQERLVSLVCDKPNCKRYGCPIHSPLIGEDSTLADR